MCKESWDGELGVDDTVHELLYTVWFSIYVAPTVSLVSVDLYSLSAFPSASR